MELNFGSGVRIYELLDRVSICLLDLFCCLNIFLKQSFVKSYLCHHDENLNIGHDRLDHHCLSK